MSKISIFLTDLGGGGAERVMLNLANGFVAQGFEVDLLLLATEGPYLSKINSGVKVVQLNANRLISSVLELATYLKRQKPDILITALEDTNVVAIVARHLAGVNIKTIVTVHNNLSQESKNLKNLKRRVAPHVVKWIYPLADLVITVSEGVAQDLIKLGIQPDKVKVIYNPIITPDFLTLSQAQPEHSWFKQQDIPIILGIGRLEQQKDFQTLIRAYSLVRQQRPARLMILGEGSQYATLLSLCEELDLRIDDDIAFPGFVDNPFAYMAHASLCVLSSAWEGFGNVLVESMGAGTPVVSTNCPSGPSEILENGQYGPLVPVGNEKAMAEAILSTLGHSIEPSILKSRAQDFSLNKILEEYQRAMFV